MDNDLLLGTRPLRRGGVARLQRARGQRVECVSGTLWITQDGDRRDVILAPGDAFDFDREGALVSALADSRYLLLQGDGARDRPAVDH